MDTRSTQLLKGTLDMCLLATIAQRPCYGYEMVQQLGLTVSQLSGMLLTMEMKRAVRRLPGNRYERAG